MKKLGLIGGLSPLSSAYFYQRFIELCRERKESRYPQIILNSVDMWAFIDIMHDHEKAYSFLKEEIVKIQDHVDFIAIPCNTAHASLQELREFSSVPIISIMEEVMKYAKNISAYKLGLLGTSITNVDSPYFQNAKKFNIDLKLLDKENVDKLDRVIFDEIVKGKFKNGAMELERQIDLIKMDCDAVILGCTELPLLINKNKDYGVPLISSTDILINSCFNAVFSI